MAIDVTMREYLQNSGPKLNIATTKLNSATLNSPVF